MSRYDLTDKVAVLTGGTSGIGRAAAIALAAAGARVVVGGRREAVTHAISIASLPSMCGRWSRQ